MPIEVAREGRLLLVTLNRPEKRNALDLAMCRELVAALTEANDDPSVGAVLLSGAGKAFCAGMDLTEAAEVDREELAAIHERLFSFDRWMLKPVLARVAGAALAGGTGLVANAHVVVAEEGATFGLTEIRIGLWPVLIFPAVIRAVGERRAVELALLGRIFSAREALAYGLATEVVPGEQLLVRSFDLAHALAGASLSATQSGLEYVHEISGKSDEEAGRIGKLVREQMMSHPDFAEGLWGFREKRPPVWPSHSTVE